MTKNQLDRIKLFSKRFYKYAGEYHGWDHILLTRESALWLAKYFKKIDLRVLEASVYLHDIGRSVKDEGHPKISIKLAQPFLKKIGLTKIEINKIEDAVLNHNKDKILQAKTKEAKILFDADKLQILTLYGFVRVLLWLVEERKMRMDKAVNFLWKYIKDVRKNYLQTKYAKRVVDREMPTINKVVDAYIAHLKCDNLNF